MFLILGLLLVAIHPSKNCYSFDNCNRQLHWQEILGDWLYLLFLLFPAVSFWITLSVPNSPCSVSTSSCTTSTPLSTNYFICSIANWIFTILRLTTSSLSNTTTTTNTNTPPRFSSASKNTLCYWSINNVTVIVICGFVFGFRFIFNSLIILCVDITTSGTITIRKCLPEFVALTVLLELPASSSLFSVSITLTLGVFRNGLFTYCGVDSKCWISACWGFLWWRGSYSYSNSLSLELLSISEPPISRAFPLSSILSKKYLKFHQYL